MHSVNNSCPLSQCFKLASREIETRLSDSSKKILRIALSVFVALASFYSLPMWQAAIVTSLSSYAIHIFIPSSEGQEPRTPNPRNEETRERVIQEPYERKICDTPPENQNERARQNRLSIPPIPHLNLAQVEQIAHKNVQDPPIGPQSLRVKSTSYYPVNPSRLRRSQTAPQRSQPDHQFGENLTSTSSDQFNTPTPYDWPEKSFGNLTPPERAYSQNSGALTPDGAEREEVSFLYGSGVNETGPSARQPLAHFYPTPPVSPPLIPHSTFPASNGDMVPDSEALGWGPSLTPLLTDYSSSAPDDDMKPHAHNSPSNSQSTQPSYYGCGPDVYARGNQLWNPTTMPPPLHRGAGGYVNPLTDALQQSPNQQWSRSDTGVSDQSDLSPESTDSRDSFGVPFERANTAPPERFHTAQSHLSDASVRPVSPEEGETNPASGPELKRTRAGDLQSMTLDQQPPKKE